MKQKNIFLIIYILILSIFFPCSIPNSARALEFQTSNITDTDNDGISDEQETQIYHTNPNLNDTDDDGFSDGDEVVYGFDPNKPTDDRLAKEIQVSLKTQTLSYKLGPYVVDTFKISSGRLGFRTPKGTFSIQDKVPEKHYKGFDRGRPYDYPHTRWNMKFKPGFYIHGAYWHHNFGHPMSHGCINVSYDKMEALYNWTDPGTAVVIN